MNGTEATEYTLAVKSVIRLLWPPHPPEATLMPVSFQIPGNLTLVDIQTPLGHPPHATLWFFANEGVQEVDVGCFLCDLKVPDAGVSLKGMGKEQG